MYKRYHINTMLAPPQFKVINQFIVERGDNCVNCGRCVCACVFDVHKRREDDVRQVAEPWDYRCKGCFRCVLDCPQGAISIIKNPEYMALGGPYWTPDLISTIWYEAETGKVPVKGAGYRGRFSGEGFDSMWTDMSEIVRPTRDGIHGREYISTFVELGRKPDWLSFNEKGELDCEIPPILEIPFPAVFNPVPWDWVNEEIQLMVAKAATEIGTHAIVEDYPMNGYLDKVIPRISARALDSFGDIGEKIRMVEIDYEDGLNKRIGLVKECFPDLVVSVRLPISPGVESKAEELTATGVDVLHLYADMCGMEFGSVNPRFIKDAISSVHRHLINKAVRDEVTILASGGIAKAEHVPKIIISGADAVAIDIPYMIALGCKVCEKCTLGCPVGLGNVDISWGVQRIVNLMCSWRDQLLEVLGAMGLREVRRLRGEVGRAIFIEDLERDGLITGVEE